MAGGSGSERGPWVALLRESVAALEAWEARNGYLPAPSPTPEERSAIAALVERLAGNPPFGAPAYAGQMLKPPANVAWVANALTMLVNPNNHALDGGPPTSHMEREAVAKLARMLGFDAHLGHLCASGTVANLEALWVAREMTAGRPVAVASNAHYTHERMCGVLGMHALRVAVDRRGRMSVDDLRRVLDVAPVGTVVATAGTTGLGAIDPIHEIAALCRERSVRLHVDAAYGGYFSLLAGRSTPLVEVEPFAAIARADSVVVDPHKHGLQPYGCGCVIFSDARVASLYAHDSPYTYFTSTAPHLGEITIECSRAGAAAAALWATLEAVPLVPDGGMGDRLAAGRRAALAAFDALGRSQLVRPLLPPETDIVCFAPRLQDTAPTASAISAAVHGAFERCATADAPLFLAKFRAPRAVVEAWWPDVVWDATEVTLLRSVLMKPEHEAWLPIWLERVERGASV